MKYSKWAFSILTLMGISFNFIFIGCGGDGGDTSTSNTNNGSVEIRGNLGSGYSSAGKLWWLADIFGTKAIASDFGNVKRMVAIPIIPNYSYPAIFIAKEIPVNSDGSFSVSLNQGEVDPETGKIYPVNYVLLIEKFDGNISIVSIPNNNGSPLSLFPISLAKAYSKIDLGMVNEENSEEGYTDIDLNYFASTTGLNTTFLANIAEEDDTLKSVVNDYINGYQKWSDYHGRMSHRIRPIFLGNLNDVTDQYEIANEYQGFQIVIEGEDKSMLSKEFENICSNSGYLKFIPASDVVLSISYGGDIVGNPEGGGERGDAIDLNGSGTIDENFTSNNPISFNSSSIYTLSDGTKICKSSEVYFEKEPDGWTYLEFNSLFAPFEGTITSSKFFSLELNGTIVGKYILKYDFPLSSDSRITGGFYLKGMFYPGIKLALKDDNNITGVEIKWYAYDPSTGSFKEINDITKNNVNQIKEFPSIELVGEDNNYNEIRIHCEGIPYTTNYIDITKCEGYRSSGIFYSSDNNNTFVLKNIFLYEKGLIDHTEVVFEY